MSRIKAGQTKGRFTKKGHGEEILFKVFFSKNPPLMPQDGSRSPTREYFSKNILCPPGTVEAMPAGLPLPGTGIGL
jgi:hypothetical protein